MQENVLQWCTRCVMNTWAPDIRFDEHGVCNYCHMHDKLERLFPLGPEGERVLAQLVEKIQRAGRGKPYDCVVGVSGGRDTSYCLYLTKKLGLRPLAVHFDNGWDSDVAKRNLSRLCQKLGVELHTVIADWQGNPLSESYRRDEVMRLMRCLPETPKAPFDDYPADDKFDEWIENARRNWARKTSITPERYQIVCALALV